MVFIRKINNKKLFKIVKHARCPICKIFFIKTRKWSILCSKDCSKLYAKNKRKIIYELNKVNNIKNCKYCNKEFVTEKHRKIFCSDECRSLHMVKYRKEYNDINKEKIVKLRQEYYSKNKDKIRKHRSNNKKYILEYERKYRNNRLKVDIEFKLKYRIQSQVRRGLKSKKDFRTFKLLNYTTGELKMHLESLFQENMSWDNYGSEWHIDHIRPVASFKLINDDGTICHNNIKKCWSLDNLQPLWAKENMIKGAKYTIDGIELDFKFGDKF